MPDSKHTPEMFDEIERLRAKLAEAEALLREINDLVFFSTGKPVLPTTMRMCIERLFPCPDCSDLRQLLEVI